MRLFIAALTFVILSGVPASADRLVVSLSNTRVAMTSDGVELVLFGSIEPGGKTSACRSRCDALVVARRPHHGRALQSGAATFLTPHLFRATIALPRNAPLGTYEVETNLRADGRTVARKRVAFELVKAGS